MGGFAETTGKAIPNELSKLNSYSNYLAAIPLIGPYLAAGVKIASAVDSGATAYGDTGKIGTSAMAGFKGYSGSTDPGQYGSGYTRTGKTTPKHDIFNTVGNIGNLLSLFSNIGGDSGGLPSNARITDQSGNLLAGNPSGGGDVAGTDQLMKLFQMLQGGGQGGGQGGQGIPFKIGVGQNKPQQVQFSEVPIFQQQPVQFPQQNNIDELLAALISPQQSPYQSYSLLRR